MIGRAWVTALCLVLTLAASPAAGWGEPVTTIRNHGDPANRLDLVILGDGYTASELGKYAADVEAFVHGVFAQGPFDEYQRYFNVHRVDVTSTQSGADHPESQVFVDTAFDATYNCAGIQRLICVDVSKVNAVLSQSVPVNSRDLVVVLVNDPAYGGSGGALAVASVHPLVVELILHETGHTLGLLADEYGGPPPPACYAPYEPAAVNATKETARELIKWRHWIDAATPIPTWWAVPAVPGLYQGAMYCDAGLYRPTFDSKMHSLGAAFEQINVEQLVKRIYNWVAPIDSVQPAGSALTLSQGQQQVFHVDGPVPVNHSLDIVWMVDDQAVHSGDTWTLNAAALTVGAHAVAVLVSDPTPLVRRDPANILTESWSWNVTVTGQGQGQIFADVPVSHPFWTWIEALAREGITGGCATNPARYCPDDSVTRGQMAVFLLRGEHGPGYLPPTPTWQTFADVPLTHSFVSWIDQLAAEGITAGCGATMYCPDDPVTRDQMAVFLLRSKYGPSYQPPDATGIFADVPLNHPFARFIEQLANEAITGGCGTNPARYCPDQPVTRGQMAVFLVRTFGLPLAGATP